MPASEARRKAASLAAIGVVFGASAWLRPPPYAPAPLLPSRIGTRAGIVVQSPRSESVQSQLRANSEPVRSQFGDSSELTAWRPRAGSEPAASRLRAGSEPVWQEPRTLPARIAFHAVAPPSVAATRVAPPADGQVSRAFASAGSHAAGGFKTAARVIRSVFQ